MIKGLMVICGALMLAGCCGSGSCPMSADKAACPAKQECAQKKAQTAVAIADEAAQPTAKKCAYGAPICTTEQTK